MFNPYWMPQAVSPINPYMPMVIPQQQVAQPSPPPVQNTIQVQQPQSNQPQLSTIWNWKVVNDYQSMLQESVPFDGTPVLFMMGDSSTFYIVNMVDGKKMVNGYEFSPISSTDSPSENKLTPEEITEQRFSKLENNLENLTKQLEQLITGAHSDESNNEIVEQPEVQRKPIK